MSKKEKNTANIGESELTKWDNIDMLLFSHIFLYRWIQKSWWYIKTIPGKLKRLGQRIIRGWDDSETWNLDITFFKWLTPRLKRFTKVTCAWPSGDEYPTFESWKEELDKRVQQCENILNIDEFDFTDHSYLSKESKALIKKNKITSESTINAMAKSDYIDDFMKWFGDNIQLLWW